MPSYAIPDRAYVAAWALLPDPAVLARLYLQNPSDRLLGCLTAAQHHLTRQIRSYFLSLPDLAGSTTTLETAFSIMMPPVPDNFPALSGLDVEIETLKKRLPFWSVIAMVKHNHISKRLIRIFLGEEGPYWQKAASKIAGCCRNHLLLHHHSSVDDRFTLVPYKCNLIACPFCSRRRSIDRFKRIMPAVLRAIEKHPNETPRHLVFTIQNCSERDLYETSANLLRAFRRYVNRDKSGFKDHFAGWLYNYEVTYNAKSKTYHPHIHCLSLGRYCDRERLSAAWSRYAAQRGLVADPRLSVHISRVGTNEPSSIAGAVLEATKYVNKPIETDAPHNVIKAIVQLTHTERGSDRKRLRFAGHGGIIEPRPEPESHYWRSLGGLLKAVQEGAVDEEKHPDFWAQLLRSVDKDPLQYNALIQRYYRAGLLHLADFQSD